jgi:hypothetical protein
METRMLRRTGKKFDKYKRIKPVPIGAAYISFSQLLDRYGGVSHMFIERQLKNNPNFPKPHRIGRLRFFSLAELEAYERASVARASSSSSEAA